MSKFLEDVPESHNFKLGNKEVKNIEDLLHELKDLKDEEFRHYVGEEHNHFVNWIKEIVKDHTLANELESVKAKQDTINIISKRIKELKAELGVSQKKPVQENIRPEIADIPKKEEAKSKPASYTFHMHRESILPFFLGLILGILIGMIIRNMSLMV